MCMIPYLRIPRMPILLFIERKMPHEMPTVNT